MLTVEPRVKAQGEGARCAPVGPDAPPASPRQSLLPLLVGSSALASASMPEFHEACSGRRLQPLERLEAERGPVTGA